VVLVGRLIIMVFKPQ